MSDMKVNVSSTLIFVWIAGSSVTAENLGFIDEFEMGVIVLSGHPERKNRLRNGTLSVVSSSVTIRSSSSTMIRLSNINGSIVDVSLTIADMRSNCNLFSQVRVSNTSSSAVAGLVYTFDAPLTGNNDDDAPLYSIRVANVSSAVLMAPSGELLQSPSSIILSMATVVMLSDAQGINIIVEHVNCSALFGNGTVYSYKTSDGVSLSLSVTNFVAALVMTSDLYAVGSEVYVTVSYTTFHFRGVEALVDVASPGPIVVGTFSLNSSSDGGGVVLTDISGVRLSSCPKGIRVLVRETSVIIDANSLVFQCKTTPPTLDNSRVEIKLFGSLLSQQSFSTLLVSAALKSPFLVFAGTINTTLVASLRSALLEQPFIKASLSKELTDSNVGFTLQNTIALRWDGDAFENSITANKATGLVDRCDRTAGCLVNVSAVFLATRVAGTTVIEVDDVMFQAIQPSSLALSGTNNIVVYFCVFSVTAEPLVTLFDTATLMTKKFESSCTTASCVVVPIASNGVVPYVSSVVVFRNSASLIFAGSVFSDSTISESSLSIAQNFGFLSTRMPENANSTSAIQFTDNSSVVIQASQFSSAAPVQQLFGKDSHSVVGTWSGSAKLVLGCNQWNGQPFPSKSTPWTLLNGVPRSARLFNSSVLMGDPRVNSLTFLHGCNVPLEGLYSTSLSLSQTPTYAAQEPQAFAITLPSFSPNTALLSLASLDSVTLIAVGQSACSSAELKKSTSDTRYLLSPFYDYGGEASTLGNIGLLVGFGVFHFLCAQCLLKGKISDRKSEPPRHSSMSQEQQQHQQQHDLASPKLNSSVRRSRRAWWPSNGFVTAHFPNVTIDAAVFLVNGTIFTAMNSITQGTTTRLSSDGLCVLAGVIGLMFTLALIGMLIVAERRNVKAKSRRPSAGEERRNVPFLHNFFFVEYSHKVRYSSRWIPAYLLPYGRWEPLEMRSSIGKLRSLCRGGNSSKAAVAYHRLAMMPSVVSAIVHGVLGVQSATSWWCPLQWTVLSLLTATCAVGIGLAQPARIPVVNVFLVIQYILQTLVFVFSAVVQNLNDDAIWAVTTLMAIATLSTVVSIAKLIHTVMIVLWERNRATAATEAEIEEAAAVTAPTLSSMFSKGQHLPVVIRSSLRPLDELFLSSPSHHFHDDAVKMSHSHNVGGTTSTASLPYYYQRQRIKDHHEEPDDKRLELSLRRLSPLSSSLSRCRIPPPLVHSSAMTDVEGGLLLRHDGSRDDSDVRNQRQSQHAATMFAQFLQLSSARHQQQSGAMDEAEQIVALEQVIQFIVKSKRN